MRKIVILLIAIIIGVGFLSGCEEQSGDGNGAYQYFQECVLDVLIAPATARFPSIDEATIVKKGEDEWGVVSYVDAENSYGALIRGYYGCEIIEVQGTWFSSSIYSGDDFSDVDHALYKWILVDKFTDDDKDVIIGGASGDTEEIKNLDTDLFYISGERWRIDWGKYGMMDRDYPMGPTLMIGSDDTTEIPLLIYESSEYGYRESDTRYVYEGENYFRLSITSFNVIDWTVEIYEGIKCE